MEEKARENDGFCKVKLKKRRGEGRRERERLKKKKKKRWFGWLCFFVLNTLRGVLPCEGV